MMKRVMIGYTQDYYQRRRSLFDSPLANEQAETPKRGNQDTIIAGYLPGYE
jgi:hypothetical protein